MRGWGAGERGAVTFVCRQGRQWYVTVPGYEDGLPAPAKLQNVDGVLEVFWIATGVTQTFLWDYIVHDCCSQTLSPAAVEAKRVLCRKRLKHFKDIENTPRKENPFPEAAGFIVTHICAQDCSLVQDFIFKPRELQ